MASKRLFSKTKKRKEPKTLILGVHGLGNKPSHATLKLWWKKALVEGLKKIEGAPKTFQFEMVYWADIMYPHSLNPRIKNPDHDLHIEEPYIAEPIPTPTIRYTPWHLAKLGFNKMKEIAFLSKNGLANYRLPFNFVVKQSFKDLDAYYNEDQTKAEFMDQLPVKSLIRNRLRRLLYKNRHKRILIVAHSMGSIITYDVLYLLQNIYEIDTFVSMGSPLGLPLIRENIANEHQLDYKEGTLLPTPESINNWYNLSDKEDHFAVFDELAEFFAPNSKEIKPIDHLVDNDYKNWVTNNAHKSYGYLRTPEMGRIVADFLNKKPDTVWEKTKKLLKDTLSKLD
ncbi:MULTISPECIES: hypothetical protein [Reichenbachiella]|uniref:PGAP1-like protein n=1 Tax=Reichenbachiella agariperforans TaxID=156994 RepID=A0A1M6PZB4_REIAG|nr:MULTISPECIES: hypothetical protein [Reichenbachiella]RJE72899.1 hypothetical protein BGP76_02815 [Reichenbachiella sp. MSK19-1]SHK13227.1 hypothetical protein SAMN04488028_103106 [Reichenbachiella agariperforans]